MTDIDPIYVPDVYVYRETQLIVRSGVLTAVPWQLVGGPWPELWTPSDPTAISTPADGPYANGAFLVTSSVRWGANQNGYRSVEIQEENSDGGWDYRAGSQVPAVEGAQTRQSPCFLFSVNPGHRVRLVLFQNCGGDLGLTAGPSGLKMRLTWIRPRLGHA